MDRRAYKYRGDLSQTSLPEMLHTIDRFHVPGVVEARQDRVIKRVYVRSGYVIHAASTDRRDSLGAHLLSKKSVKPEVLEKVSQERRHSNKRMGALLIERGLLSPAQVLRAIRDQIEGIVWSLFYWESGEVTFGLGELKNDDMVQIHLPIRQVILQGIQHAPDAKRLVSRLGQKETVLEPCFDPEQLIESGLDMGEFKILLSVDGKKTLYELCSQGPRPAADIAKLLYAYQVLQLVRPKARAAVKVGGIGTSRKGPVKIKLGSSAKKA